MHIMVVKLSTIWIVSEAYDNIYVYALTRKEIIHMYYLVKTMLFLKKESLIRPLLAFRKRPLPGLLQGSLLGSKILSVLLTILRK